MLQTLRNQIGCHVFPVHRLDRPTSGILLFGLNAEIAARLCEQFSDRSITKEYAAIVRGHSPEAGEWDEPLREKHDRKSDKRARHCKSAQDAVTRFETVQQWTVPFSAGRYETSRYSLVRISPRTGRKHQIRRHFNHMSHPVIGDTTYGDRRHNRLFREQFGIKRMLLAAVRMKFKHPVSDEPIEMVAPRGAEFDRAIHELQQQDISV